MRAAFRYPGEKGSLDHKNLRLKMHVPDDAALVTDSMVVNMVYGQAPAISYPDMYTIQLDFGDAAAKQGRIEGTATYQVRIRNQPTWPSTRASAWVEIEKEHGRYREELGRATIKMPYISIKAPGHTVMRDMTVMGRAPAGAAVSVYDNGFYLTDRISH